MPLRTTNTDSDTPMHTYTTGDDQLLDTQLIEYDILASKAHAQLLLEMKIISASELDALHSSMDHLSSTVRGPDFLLPPHIEDMHTYIEERLITDLGETGKKIHTYRSRNDQVLVALRLYMKDAVQQIKTRLQGTIKSMKQIESKQSKTRMPGYTHMQKAMPSTVGVWIGSYAAALQDIQDNSWIITVLDQNPLGSLAGFGNEGMKLPREITTSVLGFGKIQENPMYCAMSRGLFESYVLQYCTTIHGILGKLSHDLMLFTTAEFNFFSLPDKLRTGSSIMPQKKNYDPLEIIRGNTAILWGHLTQVQQCMQQVGSGYHRDYQLTKKPLLEGTQLTIASLDMMKTCIDHLQIHTTQIENGCTPELYATQQAYELVQQGMPFRDAYHKISSLYS